MNTESPTTTIVYKQGSYVPRDVRIKQVHLQIDKPIAL